MICTHCGQQNPDDSRFCSHCGTQLPHTGEPPAPAETTSVFTRPAFDEAGEGTEGGAALEEGSVESLPSGSALLVVKRGPNAGSRYVLDQDIVTAGRHPDSDIFLDDVTVSRRHAEFRRSGSEFGVHDVGSLNGTYVNRERIDDVTLSGGDEVQIGKFRLVFLTGALANDEGPRGS